MPDETEADATPPPTDHPLIDRYRDCHRVAGLATGFGTTIKAFGWVTGTLTLASGVVSSLNVLGPLKFVFAFGGFIAAALVVLVFYVVGTVVAAVGQTLRASTDTAVNTSPFLSNEQKAYVLS